MKLLRTKLLYIYVRTYIVSSSSDGADHEMRETVRSFDLQPNSSSVFVERRPHQASTYYLLVSE